MVDNLLGICFEGGTDAVVDDGPLDSEAKKEERLGVLLLKAQDDVLENRYLLRMQKWLLCDENALRYYVDFQHLTALLHFHFNPNLFHVHPPCETTVSNADSFEGPSAADGSTSPFS